MRVAFFGTYDARRHPRVKVLMEGFTSAGDEVLECNAPLGIDTAARVELLRNPARAVDLAGRLGSTWWRLWKRRRSLPDVDAVVVGYLGHLDVHLARRLWPDRPVALDFLVSLRDTAIDRRASSPSLIRALRAIDRAAVRAADVVLVDTEESISLVRPELRSRVAVVPVGAPNAWFRPPRGSEAPLRAVFFGLFTPLQGATVIGRAIEALRDEPIRFTMIGSGQDRAEAEAAAGGAPNAEWVDWMEPEQLPEVVASHDVCLGIFGAGPKGRRVVPNKVFQGAAAGCCVVTGDTPPQRRALGDAAVFVPPGDAEALASALRELAGDPDRVSALRRAASARAEEAFRPGTVVAELRRRLSGSARS